MSNVVVVGRLRRVAALRVVPPQPRRGQKRGRGRPRKYGKNKIGLAKRAGQKRGWQTIECTLYGRKVTKTYKTFLAPYPPVGGVIRVVLVQEDHGCFALFCTDPNASVAEILEAFADRATIEQDFHDVKEVWGAGQQQVPPHLDQRSRLSFESLDAYACGNMGVGPKSCGTLRPQRLAVGRCRTSAFSCESS